MWQHKAKIMKKSLLILTLLICSRLIVYAQVSFTEAKCTELLRYLEKDPVSFFKNETDPGFTFTNGNGKLITLQELINIYVNNTFNNRREVSNLSVRQVGDVGIATGLLTQTSTAKNAPKEVPYVYKGAFTYTFIQKNGKWWMTSAQHSDYPAPLEEEETAIKKTIEAETKAFFDADYKTYLSHWAKVPYASFLYAQGLFTGENLWKKMDEVWSNRKPQKMKVTRSDWNTRIKGETAFVTLRQRNENLESNAVNESFEEKYLEKINGEWKIVNNTVWSLPNR